MKFLQHWQQIECEIEFALYEGKVRESRARYEVELTAARRTLVRYLQIIRTSAVWLKARVLLACADAGDEVEVRQYADYLEVYYKGQLVEQLERARGEQKARVDYRHIIWSLVRKPGAFARYRFKEHLFPTQVFRLAYEALSRWHGGRADVEYVRILHLAANTLEARVERALSRLLEDGGPFDYAAVRVLAAPAPPQIPQLPSLSAPDLKVYDGLLQVVGR